MWGQGSQWRPRGRQAGFIVPSLGKWRIGWMGINPIPALLNTPSSTSRPPQRSHVTTTYTRLSQTRFLYSSHTYISTRILQVIVKKAQLMLIRGILQFQNCTIMPEHAEITTHKQSQGGVSGKWRGGRFLYSFKSAPTSPQWRRLKSLRKTHTH